MVFRKQLIYHAPKWSKLFPWNAGTVRRWNGSGQNMTRANNARIAGFTFLIYIVAGIASMMLFGRAASGAGAAAKLAGIAQHTSEMGIVVLLGFIQCFAALILAVTLYAITREQDPDIAMLAMAMLPTTAADCWRMSQMPSTLPRHYPVLLRNFCCSFAATC